MALGRGPIASTAISGSPSFVVATAGASGGWEPRVAFDFPTGRRKTKEERIAERRKFGIVPKAVAKVIEKVAERKLEEPDLGIDAALHRALDRERLAFKAYYAEILRLEIEARREAELHAQRIQNEEDEVVALLLLM